MDKNLNEESSYYLSDSDELQVTDEIEQIEEKTCENATNGDKNPPYDHCLYLSSHSFDED